MMNAVNGPVRITGVHHRIYNPPSTSSLTSSAAPLRSSLLSKMWRSSATSPPAVTMPSTSQQSLESNGGGHLTLTATAGPFLVDARGNLTLLVAARGGGDVHLYASKMHGDVCTFTLTDALLRVSASHGAVNVDLFAEARPLSADVDRSDGLSMDPQDTVLRVYAATDVVISA